MLHDWLLQGMVDPGEQVSLTLKREFLEEAMDSESMSAEEQNAVEEQISQHFSQGKEVRRNRKKEINRNVQFQKQGKREDRSKKRSS